jgi:hypothetical protein
LPHCVSQVTFCASPPLFLLIFSSELPTDDFLYLFLLLLRSAPNLLRKIQNLLDFFHAHTRERLKPLAESDEREREILGATFDDDFVVNAISFLVSSPSFLLAQPLSLLFAWYFLCDKFTNKTRVT